MIDLNSPFLPLLVFGGPYSNLQATQALQAEAHRRDIPPERIICTGDIVAYCADPEKTTRTIRDWGIRAIQGNCEEQLAVAGDDCGCGFEEGTACDRLAKSWYEYANSRLSPDCRRWMGNLPMALDLQFNECRVKVVHGGVRQINRFLFESDTSALSDELAWSGTDLVVAGHCGLPFVRTIGPRTWFNPGVIGMPANDGTPRGWYGLIEAADPVLPQRGLRLSVHALNYDYASAAAAVRAEGYAEPYAAALISGIWPSHDVLPEQERAETGKPLSARRWTIDVLQTQAAP